MLVQHSRGFERDARLGERRQPERVMPMDAHLHADRLVVHVDLVDADPPTAPVAVDGELVPVTAARTSGNCLDAWYVRQLLPYRSVERDRFRARVHDGVVTVMVNLRDGTDA
jgi:hypothetical protein